MNTALDPIIAFYLDSRVVKRELGFTFSNVIDFDDDTLEECHGYIQWLFPTREPSAFIANAPVVTDVTMVQYEEFRNIVRSRMQEAFSRIKRFYSMNGRCFELWVTPNNHNFLRITRIIKSLKIFGLENQCDDFYNYYLKGVLLADPERATIIGDVTQRFWKEAHEG